MYARVVGHHLATWLKLCVVVTIRISVLLLIPITLITHFFCFFELESSRGNTRDTALHSMDTAL